MPQSKASESKEINGDDLTVEMLPAVPEPTSVSFNSNTGVVYQRCDAHPNVTYRMGGFCEQCYSEDSLQRVKSVDDALAEKVIAQMDTIIQQVLDSDDDAVIERFLGRILKRFDRPQKSEVHATLQAVHLHAPVDFGPGGKK